MEKNTQHIEATRVLDFKKLDVTSDAFSENDFIPSKYTCDGENVNPSLNIKNIPDEAKCLALIVDDPDAPGGTWVHWVVWNIPVTHHLKENTVHGKQGKTDFHIHSYSGPCPPKGTHRYFFKIYALDQLLNIPADSNKHQLEKAMSNHILAFGELTGLYKKINV